MEPEGKLDSHEIQALRETHLGLSLSLSFSSINKPLHVSCGRGQALMDENGDGYLDCQNNVAHVGHCNPRVVQAAQKQLALINTNTRYLHENIVNYAKSLLATLPPHLEVVYFTNSGSEANDLAYRIACARQQAVHKSNSSGRACRDAIVLDHAYHGNTTALIELSPYKHNGKGGLGTPEHVHVLPCPDPYRNPREVTPTIVKRHLAAIRNKLRSKNKHLSVFFGESILGCAGQVVVPSEYMQTVYEEVRSMGGVCVADEVQTGFGRVGSHFWAFELQGLQPDMVTMGKPIGNGFPLGAVALTRGLANLFHNGMEYFNTFGGNPVSCLVGLSVLKEIEHMGLQVNALHIGNYLLQQWTKLAKMFPCIGHVRGKGLFLGIEFVYDQITKLPAPEIASAVCNALRDFPIGPYKGILLSTDGPYGNVVKFKPPMVFTMKDAEWLTQGLHDVLKMISNKQKMMIHAKL